MSGVRTRSRAKAPARAKGSAGAVPAEVLAGTQASRTLGELLAVDTLALLEQALPTLPLPAAVRDELRQGSITARMRCAGAAIVAAHGLASLERLRAHPSDTVRGFAAYAVGAAPGLSVHERLAHVRASADDPHFGVREWAWLAVRPALVAELEVSLEALRLWTAEPSPYLRRFASESLRPRGVWATKIDALLREPQRGERLLEPLRADGERYVQDSVANWIHDAAKSQPQWAEALCARWLRESPGKATERICHRALRSLRQ